MAKSKKRNFSKKYSNVLDTELSDVFLFDILVFKDFGWENIAGDLYHNLEDIYLKMSDSFFDTEEIYKWQNLKK